jgi:hypothetical protein
MVPAAVKVKALRPCHDRPPASVGVPFSELPSVRTPVRVNWSVIGGAAKEGGAATSAKRANAAVTTQRYRDFMGMTIG